MSFLVPLVMFGWVPVVLALFASVRVKHRAVIAAYLLAWLFLPMAGYSFQGLPDYTKMSATSFGVILGIILFDPERLRKFPFAWFDIPVVVWCLVPMASSLSNGLGAYDGLSSVVNTVVTWGLPYLIGRVYFTTPSAIKDLAIGLMLGGLIYVPLCLYEIRMSPQLHTMFYGFHQHSWGQTKRFGGFRPTVFMQHGLMVGMWMCMAALVTFWLWYAGRLRQWRSYPFVWFVVVLALTAVLCKSLGALGLALIGGAVLWSIGGGKRVWPVVLLIALVPGYIGFRATGLWSGQGAVDVAAMINEDRAGSLQFRFENEDLLAEKALRRPIVGWGGWGRNRVYNDRGEDISVTDGLWVIAFGQHGMVGVVGLFGMLLIPPWLAMRMTQRVGLDPLTRASVQVLAVVVVLYAVDCLLNGMVNPIFTLVAGSLGTVSCMKAKTYKRRATLKAANTRRLNTTPARAEGC